MANRGAQLSGSIWTLLSGIVFGAGLGACVAIGVLVLLSLLFCKMK